MNIRIAATRTLELILEQSNDIFPDFDGIDYAHIIYMLVKIKEEGMNEAKANRWLGWAQCAIVSAGASSLEEMKTINKNTYD